MRTGVTGDADGGTGLKALRRLRYSFCQRSRKQGCTEDLACVFFRFRFAAAAMVVVAAWQAGRTSPALTAGRGAAPYEWFPVAVP